MTISPYTKQKKQQLGTILIIFLIENLPHLAFTESTLRVWQMQTTFQGHYFRTATNCDVILFMRLKGEKKYIQLLTNGTLRVLRYR